MSAGCWASCSVEKTVARWDGLWAAGWGFWTAGRWEHQWVGETAAKKVAWKVTLTAAKWAGVLADSWVARWGCWWAAVMDA
jgi:hypothetical protein